MIERIGRTKIMHRIVEHNGVLYLGGIIADDTSVSMEDQTRQICQKIEALLVGAGSSKSNLFSAQLFITDMSMKEAMNKAWTEWLAPDDLPARATLGVADLGSPEILIEVVVTASR